MGQGKPQPGRLDFASGLFDGTLSRLLGEEIVEEARALRCSAGFQDTLSANFFRPDVPADGLVKAIRKDRSVARELDEALSGRIAHQQIATPEVAVFMRSAVEIPAFIHREKVAAGGRVFRSKLDIFSLIAFGLPVGVYLQGMVPAITMGLLFTNRPTKAPATIEDVLARRESRRRGLVRILETFKWFNAVAESGAGDLYGDEFVQNCRIRIVHAHVRAAINSHSDNWQYQPPFGWDRKTLGEPLSAADGSIVVATIVVTMFAMRRHLKKPISDEEMDALNHWSNYVSYLQGVPEALLCDNAHDTIVQFAAFIMSMDGRACHRPLASFMRQLQGLGFGQGLFPKARPLALLMDDLVEGAVGDVFTENVRSHFAMKPPSRRARALFRSLRFTASLVNRAASSLAPLNRVLDRQAVKLWRVAVPEAERMLSRMHGKVVG